MCTHSYGKEYNFYKFANLNLLGNKIFSGITSIKDAKDEQFDMKKLIIALDGYDPSNTIKKKTKNEVLENAKELFETRNKIIREFEDGTFPLGKNVPKEQAKEVDLSWLYRPNDELKDLIGQIESNSKLIATIDKKI